MKKKVEVRESKIIVKKKEEEEEIIKKIEGGEKLEEIEKER